MAYWEKRQEQKYLAGEMKVEEYYKKLEKAFEQSKKEIQSVINDFYIRYMGENKILSYADAQKLLNRAEIGDLRGFIAKVNKNMGKHNLGLSNMHIKARITRYQALKEQIDVILQRLYSIDYQYQGEEALKEVYSDAYYKTWYNIDRYHGFHQEFVQINPHTIEELIKYPFNGADFSTRIWKQKDHMLQQLTESITTMLVQGKNPKTLSRDFAKKFDVKEYEAYRLLHTESSFIMEQASQNAYKEDGVKKYQWLATLDLKTCEDCGPLDGKIFSVGKGITGETLPPKHIFCRCTTVPYYDDNDTSDDTRAARDPTTDKTYKVPADMDYEEWHKKYVESNQEAITAEKKLKSKLVDKKQFAEYKEKLGAKYLPKSFDEFQDLKYSSGDEYGILKAQVKGMTYYDKAVQNEPEITEHAKKVAESVGMDVAGSEYRIKGKDSYLRKIRSNYRSDGNEYEIKDILRYTYIAKPNEYTTKTLKSIATHNDLGYNTIEIKNYWLDKNNPYNGINSVVSSPKGQKFELQYHTPESYKVKDKMHSDYEKWRLMDKTSKEAQELRKSMFRQSIDMTVPRDIEKVR